MPSASHDIGESPAGCDRPGHEPVLLGETIALLAPKDGGTYLDCTFGGGGHSAAILEAAECSLVAMDRDPQAAERAAEFAGRFPGRFKFVPGPFSGLAAPEAGGYDGILMDLGVSSFQLDRAERGFSLKNDGPVDMRMDISGGETAMELILRSPLPELERIIRDYGEEPRWRKAARAVKDAASRGEIRGTLDLANAVEKALGRDPRSKIHPATLVFQALRIAVNSELDEVSEALPRAFDSLASGGVLAVITFHSLEDRIVKRFFKKAAGRPQDRHDHGSVQDRTRLGEILTRKPVSATEAERARNPRSRSAKLRAIRKD